MGAIQRFLVWLFGVNYHTTFSSIMTVVMLLPTAITFVQTAYGSTIWLPSWLTIVSAVCAFATFIYNGVMQKTKSVSGTNSKAKINTGDGMKSKDEIMNPPKDGV